MATTAAGGNTQALALLWFGLLSGPIAWTARLLLSYATVAVACASDIGGFDVAGVQGIQILVLLITLATAAVAVAGGAVSWRLWSRAGAGRPLDVPPPAGRDRFMAFGGLALNVLFLLTILLEGSAVFFLEPCA